VSHPRTQVNEIRSENLKTRLTAYAAGAVAAGVGLLVASPVADAEVIFTPTHTVFTKGILNIDLDHDGSTDFVLSIYTFIFPDHRLAARGAKADNGILGFGGSSYPPLALNAGARIGPHSSFFRFNAPAVIVTTSGFEGPFANTGNKFMGFKFNISGETHYGWALLNARTGVQDGRTGIQTTLLGYAYDTVANEAIHAGQMRAEAPRFSRAPEAGTLAALALGWPVWRRQEEQEGSSSCPPISNSGE